MYILIIITFSSSDLFNVVTLVERSAMLVSYMVSILALLSKSFFK